MNNQTEEPTTDQEERMLIASQVAELLQLDEETIRRLTRSRHIAYHKFGRRIRYDPADVRAYKARCRVVATAHP